MSRYIWNAAHPPRPAWTVEIHRRYKGDRRGPLVVSYTSYSERGAAALARRLRLEYPSEKYLIRVEPVLFAEDADNS